MARDKKKKPQAADRRRPIKKKTSILSSESIDWVDYKDVNLLRRFMSERAKIRARRVTGNSAQQQRAVGRAGPGRTETAPKRPPSSQPTRRLPRPQAARTSREGGAARRRRERRS